MSRRKLRSGTVRVPGATSWSPVLARWLQSIRSLTSLPERRRIGRPSRAVSLCGPRRQGEESVPRRIALPLILLALASSLLLALLVTSTAVSAPSRTCTAAQKAQRQAALHAYQRKMRAARRVYFKAHAKKSLRAAFVKAQQAKLTRLRHRSRVMSRMRCRTKPRFSEPRSRRSVRSCRTVQTG